jgi:16S rRNA C1402 (ribose-2'-O) methylase RsmI
MGAKSSKEIVVPVNRSPTDASIREQADKLAELDQREQLATREYQQAESLLYERGYRQGIADTLSKIDAVVEKQTLSLLDTASKDEEEKHIVNLNKTIHELESNHYRAPLHELKCKKEEDALLRCNPSMENNRCRQEITDYELCSRVTVATTLDPRKQLLQ